MDNNGKTISDKNDHYRNEKVCKQLKDKYNLTYGEGKDKVNIQKLKGAEKTKYEIYHAIKNALPKAKNWRQFEQMLSQQGVSVEYKCKRQSNEIQGISFKKGLHSFKGSDIDRSFSYSKLDTFFHENAQNHEQQLSTSKESGNNLSENLASTATEIISGLGDIFDFPPSNNPDEPEYPPRRLIKKKKKRRGFGL